MLTALTFAPNHFRIAAADPVSARRRPGRGASSRPRTLSSRWPEERQRSPAAPTIVLNAASVDEGIIDVSPEPVPEAGFEGVKAFVAGATGRTGKEIVRALVARGVKVRALARDPAAAASDLPGPEKGVEVVKGDVFKYQTLPPAIADCNVLLCATGSASLADPLGPFSVDYQGTRNLVAAGKKAGIKHFVYVSSIGADDILFPLNLAWGVLFWKKRAEEEIQRSGITYTIVRPGGLLDEPRDGKAPGNIVMKGADAFGLPPREQPGSILRSQVADCSVGAVVIDAAADAVVEVIAAESAPEKTLSELYEYVE